MNKVKDVFLWKIKLIYTIINSEKKVARNGLDHIKVNVIQTY